MRINSFFVCQILVVFEMQSFGTSLVRLKSIATGRYLTMRRNGTLRGLVSEVILIVGEEYWADMFSKPRSVIDP